MIMFCFLERGLGRGGGVYWDFLERKGVGVISMFSIGFRLSVGIE